MLRVKIESKIYTFLSKIGLLKKIFYINGPETLPAPLTNDEEAEILRHFSTNKAEVREKLIVHNLRLVVYIARKFETPLRLRI